MGGPTNPVPPPKLHDPQALIDTSEGRFREVNKKGVINNLDTYMVSETPKGTNVSLGRTKSEAQRHTNPKQTILRITVPLFLCL